MANTVAGGWWWWWWWVVQVAVPPSPGNMASLPWRAGIPCSHFAPLLLLQGSAAEGMSVSGGE